MENQTSSKSLRVIELLLVTGVAFAPSIFISLYSMFSGALTYDPQGRQAVVFYGLIYELLALAVLSYVLFRQRRSVRQIGLSFSWIDIPVSVLLSVIAYIAFYGCYVAIYYGSYYVTGSTSTPPIQAKSYIDAGVSIGTIVFVVINPLFEELIVRAYTISEVKFLTGSSVVAVFASVVLQVLYHLYQGVPAAVALGAMFLVMSIYFVKNGRIIPVILAHLYFDVMALLSYPK